jgi:hypothetical protein
LFLSCWPSDCFCGLLGSRVTACKHVETQHKALYGISTDVLLRHVYLSVYLSIYLSIYLSVCLSVCLYVYDPTVFFGPWPLSQFLNFIHSRYDSLEGDQPVAMPLPVHRRTQAQNKHT